jgi:adenylate cyclase
MDRIWQWAWDRYGASYSWAILGIGYLALLPVYLDRPHSSTGDPMP